MNTNIESILEQITTLERTLEQLTMEGAGPMGPKRNEETWLSDVKLVQKQVLTLTERVKRLASSLDSLEADYHRRHELDSDFNSDGCNPYRG